MKIKCDEIKLGKRIRKDMGDIDTLISSIKKLGLLQPIGVTKNNELIFGQRRLVACMSLGYEEIEASIIDIEEIIAGEYAENCVRKDFTMTERAAIRKIVEPAIKAANLERQGRRNDLNIVSESDTKSKINNGLNIVSEPDTTVKPSKTRDQVAKYLGVGKDKMKQEEFILEHADDEIIEAVDSGKLSTNAAYEKIRKEVKGIKKKQKKEEQQNKLIEVGKTYNSDDIKIIHGDFVEKCADIEPNSVDLILTDLPYPKKYLNLWSELSLIAERVLKPSGFCISYTGQLYLLEVMNRMAEHLNYYWQICFHHVGPTNLVHARNVVNEQKPILVYQKAPFKKAENVFVDIIDSDSRDKDLHEWQQGETGFKILLERFSSPGDLVLEPCAGAGTVPYCCKQLKRRCIAIEIDKKYVDICKGRLS